MLQAAKNSAEAGMKAMQGQVKSYREKFQTAKDLADKRGVAATASESKVKLLTDAASVDAAAAVTAAAEAAARERTKAGRRVSAEAECEQLQERVRTVERESAQTRSCPRYDS